MVLLLGQVLAEGLGGVLELDQHAGVARHQAPLLGGWQLGWNLELGQLGKGLADLLQAPLQLRGGRRDDKVLGGSWSQHLQRPLQKLAPVDLIGDSVAGDQRQGLAMLEAVAMDADKHEILVLLLQRAQGMSQARPDRPPSLHPLGFAAEQACDPRGCQPVLLQQRADHSCLVQGGQRAWRCVGEQQQTLVLLHRRGTLHHHGNPLAALLPPALEPFEAVDDLVAPVLTGHDANRERRQRFRRGPWGPWPQRRVAGA
jgi:hypothetical protein